MKTRKEKFPQIPITISDIIRLIFLTVPFFLMDCFVRLSTITVNYHMLVAILPSILFTLVWIAVIILISVCFNKVIGRIFYGLCFIAFFLMFVCQSFYFEYAESIFSFGYLKSSAMPAFNISKMFKSAGVFVYLKCIVVFIAGVFAIIKFPNKKKNHFAPMLPIFGLFIVAHTVVPWGLGIPNTSLKWNTWQNPQNVYMDFIDSNKTIKICGFYEYTIRDIGTAFFKPKKEPTDQELIFLKDSYKEKTLHQANEYTGIFKGKNVIFLQLEGIDSWLLTEEDMPNLYGMLNNSMVFDNHYSFYNSGGSTFNSEFTINTGFITPFSYTHNAYAFTKNRFSYALPRMLKASGYSANAFHMNSGEYYMRTLNYRNWGYDNYYSLMDDTEYKDDSYQFDRELILNRFFYDKMFKRKKPFMNYVITYTPHTPFSIKSGMGKSLAREVYGKDAELPDMNEEESARFFAAETDRMIGLLLGALQDTGLYEDTVIVAFTDHYLYTLKDQSIIEKYKTSENNLVNNTPFFIWSYDTEYTKISKVNSQLDIMPTVLNMFGIEYYNEHYIGSDIMDENYSGYVFFNDYSWYDGVNYVEEDTIDTENEYINEMNKKINDLIKRNDLTLKYNYLK